MLLEEVTPQNTNSSGDHIATKFSISEIGKDDVAFLKARSSENDDADGTEGFLIINSPSISPQAGFAEIIREYLDQTPGANRYLYGYIFFGF